MYWSSSSGRIELNITKAQAHSGYHSGSCDDSVAGLMDEPAIRRQLKKLSPDLVRSELEGYGFDDISDDKDNLDRLLWIACGDIVEGC